MPADTRYKLADLLRVMARLRDPQRGCAWDLAQDFNSIVPSTLEEAYELAAAIEHGDHPHVAEELGDLLFQVVFYARLGEEQKLFDFPSIVSNLAEKLIRRHPHVFANGELEGVVVERLKMDAIAKSWEAIKRSERHARDQTSILADIPLALPAISRAQKLQERAASVGFDWPDYSGVLAKLEEEIAEYISARDESPQRQEEELGDILFTAVNLARHAGIDAEAALRHASTRFEQRFGYMERAARELDSELADHSAEELERLWRKAKYDA